MLSDWRCKAGQTCNSDDPEATATLFPGMANDIGDGKQPTRTMEMPRTLPRAAPALKVSSASRLKTSTTAVRTAPGPDGRCVSIPI